MTKVPGYNTTRMSRRLPSDLRLSPDASADEIREKYNRLLDAISNRFDQGDERHAAHAGHLGTTKQNADIDLQGKYRIINAAPAQKSTDLATKGQAETSLDDLVAALQAPDSEVLTLLGLSGGDDVTSDAIASAVTILYFEWSNAKMGYALDWKPPLNNAQAVKYYKVAFFNSTNFLDTTDGSVAASESAATITRTKSKFVLQINAANFNSAFSTGLDVKITPVSLIDGNYVDGAPTTFGSLVVAGNDFLNANDSVNRTTAGVTAGSPINMIRNGHFRRADGGGNLKLWKTWHAALGTPISGVYVSITTATVPAKWIKASHSLEWSDSSEMVIISLDKQLLPGVKYYMTFWCKGSAATSGLSIRVYYKRNTDAADNMDNVDNGALAYVPILLTGLSTSFQYFGGQLKVDDSPSLDDGGGGYSDQYLVLEIGGTLGGTVLTLDKMQMGEGSLPFNFSPYGDEQDSADLLPSAAPALPDVGYTIDTRGGFYKDPGEGGPITLYA